jgi:AraC-like DNA-binding protein
LSTIHPDERQKKYLREEYIGRNNRVIDYTEKNIDKDLSLETLAGVANFSRFHFHRIFKAMMGETLNQFILRIRIERAAALLIHNPKKSITEMRLADLNWPTMNSNRPGMPLTASGCRAADTSPTTTHAWRFVTTIPTNTRKKSILLTSASRSYRCRSDLSEAQFAVIRERNLVNCWSSTGVWKNSALRSGNWV